MARLRLVKTAEIEIDYLRCKAMRRHVLDPCASGLGPPSFGVAYDFRCMSCGTMRRDICRYSDSELLARYYVYPDDYKKLKGGDTLYWRDMYYKRLRVLNPEAVTDTPKKVHRNSKLA